MSYAIRLPSYDANNVRVSRVSVICTLRSTIAATAVAFSIRKHRILLVLSTVVARDMPPITNTATVLVTRHQCVKYLKRQRSQVRYKNQKSV
jgi:hypothetical protein